MPSSLYDPTIDLVEAVEGEVARLVEALPAPEPAALDFAAVAFLPAIA